MEDEKKFKRQAAMGLLQLLKPRNQREESRVVRYTQMLWAINRRFKRYRFLRTKRKGLMEISRAERMLHNQRVARTARAAVRGPSVAILVAVKDCVPLPKLHRPFLLDWYSFITARLRPRRKKLTVPSGGAIPLGRAANRKGGSLGYALRRQPESKGHGDGAKRDTNLQIEGLRAEIRPVTSLFSIAKNK